MATWSPSIGAIVREEGTYFRVWAPAAEMVEVVLDNREYSSRLVRQNDGSWNGYLAEVTAGDLYRYRLNERDSFPDPASRFQPHGVHGPSQVIDPLKFRWTDDAWGGTDRGDLIIYELHTGTFAGGTFAGVIGRLDHLVELGVTAIEIMPVADFPGRWNWGYDGVDLFAPARCYGTPDDLRELVNAAHLKGLSVILDVVYNHFGPDGAYWRQFSPQYFSDKHFTPWGEAINFDGQGCRMARDFFIENALYWIHEFHVDGLRLDATHSIIDDSEEHFCAELVRKVKESTTRKVHIIAEDHRNLAKIIQPVNKDGWGMDAMWSDDFHHICRRLICGDSDGYFSDYRDSAEDLAAALQKGWLFTGQHSSYFNAPRGTEPEYITQDQLVIFLQNHDQIGNRPQGQRLNHQVSKDIYRAISVLLLCAPQLPMLFMGQEWSASNPFCYFTDHNQELGKLVTEGRRKEFKRFKGFSDPEAQLLIPDPQELSTFEQSRLNWNELNSNDHSETLAMYKTVLGFRKQIITDEYKVSSKDGLITIKYDKHYVYVCLNSSDGQFEVEAPAKGTSRFTTGKVRIQSGKIQFEGAGAVVIELKEN